MIGLSGIFAYLSAATIIGLSPDIPVSYQMDIKLDTAAHKIRGVENIEFLNPTANPLARLCFHLYPNAFSDTASVFCREDKRAKNEVAAGNTSNLAVSEITIDGQLLESHRITKSGTLLYLDLPAPLPPKGRVVISLNFELLIPKTIMRFGYNDFGNYLLSHWHPIICGYQGERLIDNEYYVNSEFFSNFSNYDVRLEIPSNFAVGSTGELTQLSKDSSRAVWHAVADTVIDFAFSCGPAFEISQSETLGINLRYMIERRHLKYEPAADAMTKMSIAYNSSRYFSYPYKSFTLVDFSMGAEGMELPGMAVVAFPSSHMLSGGQTLLNLAISHEVTHEWFYAAIATNEAEEPWLDEGLTSYGTNRLLSSGGDKLSEVSILGYRLGWDTAERAFGLIARAEWPINLKSWNYPDEMSYGAAVYYRASLVIQTLESLAGREKFDSFLKTYAGNFRFRHPNGDDFINTANIMLNMDMTSFYNQFIRGTARLDYGIRSLEYSALHDPDSTKKYEVTVTVARELDGILPQTISLILESGARVDSLWDGESRIATYKFYTASRPLYAVLNLDRPYPLDENISNNSLYLKSFGGRIMSFEWDAVFLVEMLLSLIL